MNYKTAAEMVEREYDRAASIFPRFHSGHEGYAVLLEEVDEVWEIVKHGAPLGGRPDLREECVQVAAMAMRMLIDLC